MSFFFSGSELSALVRAATILLSPLEYDDAQEWERDACSAVQLVLDGDASSSAFPVDGNTVLGGEPDVVDVPERTFPPPEWARHALIDNDIVLPNHLLAPMCMMDEVIAGDIPATIAVYYEDERKPAETVARQKVKLHMILPALIGGVKAYTTMMRRQSAEIAMADAAPCGVALCDRNGVILHVNDHLSRLLGDDRDEAVVRNEIAECARAAVSHAAKKASIGTTRRATSEVRTQCAHYTFSAALLGNERRGGRICSTVFVDAHDSRALDPRAAALRNGLTRRETEIALFLQRGYSSKEIATAVGISVNTVRRHIEHVMAKFGVHTRLGVAAKLAE
ncbi:MAG TPA: helix-turn-helix transcriptional regulator [Gemmatimonadaceae bacterium]|nr:helix-turn-helix transcriptional regulator [Gemmatimonadaceae bacterium]